jgi:hypothetical protein
VRAFPQKLGGLRIDVGRDGEAQRARSGGDPAPARAALRVGGEQEREQAGGGERGQRPPLREHVPGREEGAPGVLEQAHERRLGLRRRRVQGVPAGRVTPR